MSLYQEVKTVLERAKLEKELIEGVKKSASQCNTQCTFNEVPEDLVKELFPPPFRVKTVGESTVLVDWSSEACVESVRTTNMVGDVYWKHPLTGDLHREDGLPAVEWANGTKEWYVNGKHHREGGLPAIERNDGDKAWYVNGKLHREGGLPASEWASGTKAWYVNGKLHREDGLPAVEWANGTKEWYVNGKRHREAGLPAVERTNGDKEWWVNGELHRDCDLPAVDTFYSKYWYTKGNYIRHIIIIDSNN